jgi:AmmeMemoRadiSam system protein A
MDLSAAQRSMILDLTRSFVRRALEGSPLTSPDELDPIFREPAGCFVSLHSLDGNRLRGCVGRIDASQPLERALRSASAHVLRDPRFATEPVELDEFPSLSIEVSVLSAPRPVPTPLDFEPTEHGILLSLGNLTGCFLPQVARETGWTREQLLDRLCTEKLGLSAGAWRNPQAKLLVFSVTVVGPEPSENELLIAD